MTDGLVVPLELAELALAHASDELPNEACGLLGGDAGSGYVTTFHTAGNVEASPYGFEIGSEDLVRIVLAIERDGEDLVGIFHSHPRTPAVPSVRDIRSARYPVVHLIASMCGPETNLRAWRIDGGAAREVELTLDRSQQPDEISSTRVPARASTSSSTAQDPSSPPER